MNILIYGPDRPKFGLEQYPDGSMEVQVENDHTYSTDTLPDTIAWADLYDGNLASQCSWRVENDAAEELEQEEKELFESFISDLRGLIESEREDKFFKLYAERVMRLGHYCGFERSAFAFPAWSHPALIPQVWVNWYYFDSSDRERAQLAREEPFRVDFMIKDACSPVEDLRILEVDDSSHFGGTEVGPDGSLLLNASMREYTLHLKKDRWLRKKGWNVVRISSKEVKDLEDEKEAFSFINEVLNRKVSPIPRNDPF